MITEILCLIMFTIGLLTDDDRIFKKVILFLLFVCALK